MNTMPLEAETRVLIDRSLENLGWKLSGTDQNVFFEQPKTETERKKLGGKRPDYVLYAKDARPLIVIEAKKRGARIDAALEQGINYARTLGAPLVFATDGVFCKTFHTIANRPPVLNGEERNMATGNEELQKILRKSTIYGNEITNTARITKMNMILAGDGHSNIQMKDSLAEPVDGKYDIVLANMPYSQRTKDFWYFDVKSDGYSLDNHRRKLNTPSDLSKFEEYRKLDKDQAADMLEVGFEIIPLDEVRKKSNILVGSRYRTASIKSTQYPMISLGDEGYFTICSGGTPSSTIPEYWNGDINWITLADLPADDLVTEIKISERMTYR